MKTVPGSEYQLFSPTGNKRLEANRTKKWCLVLCGCCFPECFSYMVLWCKLMPGSKAPKLKDSIWPTGKPVCVWYLFLLEVNGTLVLLRHKLALSVLRCGNHVWVWILAEWQQWIIYSLFSKHSFLTRNCLNYPLLEFLLKSKFSEIIWITSLLQISQLQTPPNKFIGE